MQNKMIGHIENGVYVTTATPDETDYGKPLPKNIPSFDGGRFDGIYSAGDSCFVACISEVEENEFLKYTEKLEASGFSRFAENKMAQNLFYTYKNAASYVFAYYIKPLKTVKIIAEPYYDFVSETPENDTVKPAVIASSACDRNFYVRLPDNSLVIVDGGWRIEDRTRYSISELLEEMYNEMRDITGEDIIKVPLWIITHGHTDHAMAAEFLYTLPLAKKFIIERILYNFPAVNHTDDGVALTDEQLRELEEKLEKWHNAAGKEIPYENIFYNSPVFIPDPYRYENICRNAFKNYGAVLIKAHSGMKLNLCGVTFEVLHTPEDDMPTVFKNKNDSSVIIKMTYKNSPMLWLGDMGEIPSTSCVKMYGDYLKSDAMQVSHHGWGAATPEFYSTVRPSVLFWNNSEFGFKYADKYQGYGKTKTSTDLYNMDCVKKNFFCNRITMSYAYLPVNLKEFTAGGGKCKILASAVSDRTFMIRLNNGKLIVIDGGFRKEIWNMLDKESLINGMYEEMKLLAGSDEVTVAALISTDFYAHNNRLSEYLCADGIKQKIKTEKIIYNFPPVSKIGEKYMLEELRASLINCFNGLCEETVIAKTDMSLDIYGMNLKILYAPDKEDFYPEVADTSLVFKLSYGEESIIFTGDMTDSVSRKLINKYGKQLKCDAVQIANHGYNNCGVREFYELCAARLQLWNNSEYGYRFFRENEGYAKTKASTDVFWLKSCMLNVFCDQVKPQIFEFPLNEDELNFNNNTK